MARAEPTDKAKNDPYRAPRHGDTSSGSAGDGKGKWMALTAALLGWMFDGFEMGLFPLVARPALRDLLGGTGGEGAVGLWFGVITAGFLVGRGDRRRACSAGWATASAACGP